jgi:probable selenium-dependent hydroxylase accessory protein YqeC
VDRVVAHADIVLVEADGARRRSFKMPADHEPVVPDSARCLVVVAGLDVLGQPLDDAHVHRHERVAAAARQPIGSVVTEDTIVAALSDPAGYPSRGAAGGRVILFLNKAEDNRLAAALRLAYRLQNVYERVLVGSAREGVPRRVSVDIQR